MPSTMKPCRSCEHYVRVQDRSCPFCHTALFTDAPRRQAGPVAALGLTMMLGSVACGPNSDGDSDGSSGAQADSSTTVAASSSSGPGATESSSGGTSTSTSTETGADSSSSDDGLPDGGGSFYAGAPDAGPSVFECSIVPQSCGENEKCMPWAHDGEEAWSATRCSPIAADPNTVGEPCTVEASPYSGFDDCDGDSMCFGVDPKTLEGTCAAFCTGDLGDPQCAAAGDTCYVSHEGTIAVCQPSCNPLLDECAEGDGCFPDASAENFACVASLAPASEHGDPCNDLRGCAAGQMCVGGGIISECSGDFCCTTICDAADPDADIQCGMLDPGQTCLEWFIGGSAPDGLDSLGICGEV